MADIPNRVRIEGGRLNGEVKVPPSKSIMQRVLALLLLRNGSLQIRNPGKSRDDQTMLSILESAGFGIENEEDALTVSAPEKQSLTDIHFGDSGLAARMLLPILASRAAPVTLDASAQLRGRGLGLLPESLRNAGVQIETDETGWVQSVQGPFRTGDINIDGTFSSQPVTGLLYAMAAGTDAAVLQVTNAVSRPYIDLSLRIMEDLGLPLPKQDGYHRFEFAAGRRTKPLPATYQIEGDWSAGAFWLVAGAIAGPLRVTGLDAFTAQGDKEVLQALMDAGAGLSIESGQVTVRPAILHAFHFNANETPDLFPPLAVLGCFARGQSVIEGVGRLRSKESDRAATIISELTKLGAEIRLQDDLMIVTGGQLHGGTVDAHNDHRIAMMCAITALRANGPIVIEGAAAVEKSYPAFFTDLQALGARLSFD